MTLQFNRVIAVDGSYRPPSDKSLTHRAYMLAALAESESWVRNPLRGEDCEATLRILNQLGLRHEWRSDSEIRLIPTPEWQQPKSPLNCGNSGTTIRLLAGIVAARNLECTFVGDASLSRRPMSRIAKPLSQMGAIVEGNTPPLLIKGGPLHGIRYDSPVPSAQVKSCVLLAGLGAEGKTTVHEQVKSRDHTERMLASLGVELDYPLVDGYAVSIEGGQTFSGFEFSVPADISSAAYAMVAAATLPGSNLQVEDLVMNSTRTGILDVFRQCRVPFQIGEDHEELGEPVADVRCSGSTHLAPFQIEAELVPRLIDEIPVLCVLATQCHGISTIRGAKELRVKESDRIDVMAQGLRRMGAQVETFEDGLSISGPTPLTGITVDTHGDHRIGMSFAVAGMIADGVTTIENADAIATSYPAFQQDMMRLSVV